MKKKEADTQAETQTRRTRKSQAESPAAETRTAAPEQQTAPERRPPQLVTVNGDKFSHAHVFKSKFSDDWFFTAKLNDIPLKPQKASQGDVEAVINKTRPIEEMIQKFYPSKLLPRIPEQAFRLPQEIHTPGGNYDIIKFNAYKESNPDSIDAGKYRFYAQVGNMKMSAPASHEDLDAYFDRTKTPTQMVTRVFGDRLNMPEHYAMFKLPEGSDIQEKNIHIIKNRETNRYQISVDMPQGKTSAMELSYNDRQSYFGTKTATKEQLAAKYLGDEIKTMMQAVPKMENDIQKKMNR